MMAGAGAGLEVTGGIKISSEVIVGMLCLFFCFLLWNDRQCSPPTVEDDAA